MQPKTFVALGAAMLATALVAVSTGAAAGPWAELHQAPDIQSVQIVRSHEDKRVCLLHVRYAAAAKATAKAEGAPDARWRETMKVSCAAVGTLLQSATVYDDCQRPAAWAQGRAAAPDKRTCK